MSAPNLARFVTERRPSWDRLGTLLTQVEQGRLSLEELEELDRLYRRTAADLARARTAFPDSDVTSFLNELVLRGHRSIYRRRPRPWTQLRTFFGREVPEAFHALRRFGLAAALLLVVGIGTGGLATLVDERVAEALAPPELIEGVRDGRMWTDDVLSVAPPSVVSTKILTNNVGVTFTAFALGIALGLPTAIVVFFNGFLVGALGALCARYGLLGGFLDFVLSHGLLELTVVCLGAGAGLGLGMALVDPGERPRLEALQERARHGVRLLVGCAPALVLVGFVEGYVSPGALFPTWVKALVGLTLEALFLLWITRRSVARS